MRRDNPPRDFMLGDISNEFVQMLQQLREANVRFGFISDAIGMEVGSQGRSEFAALTRLLDQLLRVEGAMPDFWMAWSGFPQIGGMALQDRGEPRRRVGAEMIRRAIEWYGVEKKSTIFVSSTDADLLAAKDADITGIHYAGSKRNRTTPASVETESQFLSPPESRAIQRLRTEIERILGLRRRQSA